jgi:hypothetical protein
MLELLKMVEQGELDSRKCKNNLKFRVCRDCYMSPYLHGNILGDKCNDVCDGPYGEGCECAHHCLSNTIWVKADKVVIK